MIPIQITINKKTTKAQLPTDWSEITFDQYIRIFNIKNDADLLSIFTGVDTETILKAKIKGVEDILYHLDFLQEKPDWGKLPKTFMGVTIPKDITYHSLAPYIDSKASMKSVSDYAKVVAIYVQAVRADWDGYDFDKAMELVPEIMQQPASEVVGLGNFFIVKLWPLKKNTKANFPKEVSRPKKNKRVTKS